MILALKTDGEITEFILLDQNGQIQNRLEWQSARGLAEGLLGHVLELLGQNSLHDLSGLIVFRGPGSFTSLRIGISTINALAYGLAVPNVGTTSEDWLKVGLAQLSKQGKPQIVNVQVGPEQIPAQIIRGATPICFQLVLDGSQPFFMMVDQCVNPLPVMGKR